MSEGINQINGEVLFGYYINAVLLIQTFLYCIEEGVVGYITENREIGNEITVTNQMIWV